MAIFKEARTPSKDPVQEKLRQNKANWNKEVSEFINNLIHLKKTMNGWPSKFFKERSKITAPIPADPATIIGALAGDFSDLVNRGNSIIQEQINYSKNRRQPGQKNNSPESPLEQALTANDQSYYLISEASNPLTRFFSKMFSKRVGEGESDQKNRVRVSLLNACATFYKDLAYFQAAIVGSGAESIFLASKLFDKLENNWAFIVSGIGMAQQSFPDTFVHKDKKEEPIPPVIDYIVAPELPQEQPQIEKTIQTPLDDKKEQKTNLQVQSQKALNRWVGKLNHNLSIFDKSSDIRVNIYNLVKDLRQEVNKTLNSLEKDLNVDNLLNSAKQIEASLEHIKSGLKVLTSTINGTGYSNKYIDLLQKGKLTDYPINFDRSQKEHLDKMLRRKQLQDISKMYGKKQ